MNIFQAVKEAVSCRDAASFYGIKVGGSGLCRCPFHNDNTPSMKVDIRYYCFGCGAKGDVIDFVGKLYGLRPYDAARKIADDFRIIDYDNYSNHRNIENKKGDSNRVSFIFVLFFFLIDDILWHQNLLATIFVVDDELTNFQTCHQVGNFVCTVIPRP